jgi:2-C-methyl-D-erythritol 4-phosphate cytidylyltransferase
MGGRKKEYLPLPEGAGGAAASEAGDGRLTVLGAAALAFAGCARIGVIVITVPLDADTGEFAARDALPRSLLLRGSPEIFFVPGGSSRRISVHHALSTLAGSNPDYVLIHDGARPWVSAALIDRVIDAVMRYDAVLPVTPLSETPKEIDGMFVKRHLKRPAVVLAQTPQAFAFNALLAAHEKAAERELAEAVEYTDDAEVWGEFAGSVAVIDGDKSNRKITFPEDMPL